MSLFDFNDPFYRPLWLRVLLVAITFGWGVFEFVSGYPFWGTIFCGVAALAFYGFFVSFNPRVGQSETDKE